MVEVEDSIDNGVLFNRMNKRCSSCYIDTVQPSTEDIDAVFYEICIIGFISLRANLMLEIMKGNKVLIGGEVEKAEMEADIEISEDCLTQLRLSKSPYFLWLTLEKWRVKFDFLNETISFLNFVSESDSNTDESAVFVLEEDRVGGLKVESVFYLSVIHEDSRLMDKGIAFGQSL